MPHCYSSSSSDYYEEPNDCDDEYIECSHCPAQVKRRNYQRHLDNLHKCNHCNHYMPQSSIEAHIERKHMRQCAYCPENLLEWDIERHESTHFVVCTFCNASILRSNLNKHTANDHPFRATVGMIRLDKFTTDQFNRMLNQNRIYCKDGHLFVK